MSDFPSDLDFSNTDPFKLLKELTGGHNYQPRNKETDILDAAWNHIQSVDYAVSARWLFYRLLQDGFYSKKNDYKNKYIPLMSRARKNYYEGWRPDTLVDDGRNQKERSGGYSGAEAWAKSYSEASFKCEIDHFYMQANITMVVFEAVAMARQFEHYTRAVDLWPFGGMPSIEYKYRMAKHIEYCDKRYDKPVKVLYFGDYDPAGLIIPETSFADIEEWCGVGFEFIRCGLNAGDEIKYNIPENLDHPGTYQWEALNDKAAASIIKGAVNQYVDQAIIDDYEQRGSEAAEILDQYMDGFYDYYQANMSGEDA